MKKDPRPTVETIGIAAAIAQYEPELLELFSKSELEKLVRVWLFRLKMAGRVSKKMD